MGDARLTRLVVTDDHLHAINVSLDYLLHEANVKIAVLLDRSGQIVGCRGEAEPQATVALGALVAGNFASAREIARLIGEDGFGAVLQQGQNQHIFTALVNEHWMLSVVFDAATPVGMVRLLCHRAALDLQPVHRAVCESAAAASPFDREFHLLAERTIDLLLQDGT